MNNGDCCTRDILLCGDTFGYSSSGGTSYDALRLLVDEPEYKVATYVKKIAVKAGEYVHLPHEADIVLGFSSEHGTVKVSYSHVFHLDEKIHLNDADVGYVTPMPIRCMNYTSIFVSCDVDTTIFILCGMLDMTLRLKLHNHVFELEDGRRYSPSMELLPYVNTKSAITSSRG